MKRSTAFLLIVVACSVPIPARLQAQQAADTTYDTRVSRPAYAQAGPRVLFDEAHHNAHKSTDRYRLLIADHLPMGAAAQRLANQFGVQMGNCLTVDTTAANHVGQNAGVLLFSRDNGLLRDHPITVGRDSMERIHSVFAFGGQSLAGPPGSSSFLVLSDVAVDLVATSLRDILSTKVRRSAAGRSQGLAFDFGKGRVVVLGEAAMFSAQWSGPQHANMGMNVPGSDDRQLALNVMHWLSGALD